MKKIISILMTLALLFSLASCGEETTKASVAVAEADSGSAPSATQSEETAETLSSEETTTVSGTVESVEGNTVTLTDGTVFTLTDETVYTFSMPEMEQGGEMPEMPEGGEMPQGGMDGEFDGQEPPEKPDGEQDGEMPEMPEGGEMPQGGMGGGMPQGGGQGGQEPPEMPDGEQDDEMPEMPEGGEMPQGDMEPGAEQLTVGSSVTVKLNADGTAAEVAISMDGGFGGGMNGGFGGMGGGFGGDMGGNEDITYSAVETYTKDVKLSGESFSSTGKDENAILVTDGELTLKNADIDRSSADSTGGDNSSFYGVGAAVLTTGGSVNISDSTITTDAAGGAGVFAYGDGTAYVSDTDISTKQNCSGGIHVAGGGTLYAWDLNVVTEGESSAAIRSDRGSGTMVVDGGSYTSNGTGSPAIYSTADITVNNATLTANGSEAICIEGMNSIRLFDCNLSGNMSDDSRNDCCWNVILYQSMSGDSQIGNSLFEMVGGTLTAKNGGVFYTTNTESTFILSGVDIQCAEDCEFLLRCTGNSNERGWGQTGANGADCSFYAIAQTLQGDVIWDGISTLRLSLTEGSTLTGAILLEEGLDGDGSAEVTIASGCSWIVTGNSTLTSLSCAGSIVDESGRAVSVIGTDGTVFVQGESEYTITVETYSDSAADTADVEVSSFADYAVTKK